ncbi:MAG: glycosyltransferase family 9 protein, partial [bacterium]
HRSIRSALLAFLCGAKERVGFGGTMGSLLLTRKTKRDLTKHEIIRNLSLLEPFFGKVEPVPPEIFPTKDDFVFVKEKLKDVFDGSFGWRVIFAPGSAWATKRYPRVYFTELGKLLLEYGIKFIIIIGGKEDWRICKDIKDRIGERAINVAGMFTPLQSCALMTMC